MSTMVRVRCLKNNRDNYVKDKGKARSTRKSGLARINIEKQGRVNTEMNK